MKFNEKNQSVSNYEGNGVDWITELSTHYNPLAFQLGILFDHTTHVPDSAVAKVFATYISTQRQLLANSTNPKFKQINGLLDDTLEKRLATQVIESDSSGVSYAIMGYSFFNLFHYPLEVTQPPEEAVDRLSKYSGKDDPDKFYLSYLAGTPQEVLKEKDSRLYQALKDIDFLEFVPRIQQ